MGSSTGKRKSRSKVRKGPEPLFDSLVSNAVDFLKRSIRDLKPRPKYSIINFCSGLEIFLKARLLQEHWSLIVKRPEDASLTQFEKGNFYSVTMDEAIKRLQNVAGDTFPAEEIQCFQKLRDHRNKVVHFFHDAYKKKASEKILEEIAAEQCKAWFYLHRRITGPWAEHFRGYQAVIEKLNKQLHDHRVFLRAKFATLNPEIEKEIAAGVEYGNCGSCGFRAARTDEIAEPSYRSDCIVCGARHSFLRLPCPKCGETTDIDDLATAFCGNEDCESEITLADVMEKYAPTYDPRDGGESPLSYCASCEHPEETVIPLGDGHFCFWCREWFERVEQCEWCGTSLAGFDPELSYLHGCFLCEDAAREHFDRKM